MMNTQKQTAWRHLYVGVCCLDVCVCYKPQVNEDEPTMANETSHFPLRSSQHENAVH